jgi:hypothetical protein
VSVYKSFVTSILIINIFKMGKGNKKSRSNSEKKKKKDKKKDHKKS